MRRYSVPFVTGLLFAVGLALSGMTRPSKVIGFLDLAGDWDPSLALVMLGAILVFGAVFWFSRGMKKPVLAEAFATLPTGKIDVRLIVGAVLFGVGWGVAGFCPGPAIVSAGSGASQSVAFCVAMALGFWGTRMIDGRIKRAPVRASEVG